MRILDSNHIINGNEYFRQKAFCPYDSDNYAVSTFVCKWTSIRYLIGDVWKNRALNELDEKDTHYPYNPSFLNTYEFIEFENDEEKKLVSKYSDQDIKEKLNKMWWCYRLWNDWTIHYIFELNEYEIMKIYHTPLNLCPHCKKGTIIEKHGKYGKFNGCSNFPECHYIENRLNDDYHDFLIYNEELQQLKKTIEKVFHIK